MNEFQYSIKLQELKRLTTKKSKSAFIREARCNDSAYFDIKLLIDISNIITDKTISGVKSINVAINNSLTNAELTADEVVKLLEVVPKRRCAVYNDYTAFMASAGVPAYLKLAVMQAENAVEE